MNKTTRTIIVGTMMLAAGCATNPQSGPKASDDSPSATKVSYGVVGNSAP